MTTRERLERKLEKRREWAAAAAARSEEAFNRAHNLTAPIPFGQPNVGGRLTGVLKRANSAMSRSCAESDKAQYHEDKAEGLERALEMNIYSDDPDAVEKLQARIAELEEIQDTCKIANKVIREKKLTDEEKAEKIAMLTGAKLEAARQWVAAGGFPSYSLTNNNANIRRLEKRLAEIKARSERSAKAEASATGVLIEYNGDKTLCHITFAEKPDREVLTALKEAGYWWRGGCWRGEVAKMPDSVKQLLEA